MVTNAKNLNDYFKLHQPAIVDIMPTMLHTLNINPEKNQLWEIDGMPLVGKTSLTNAKSVRNGNKLHISWDAIETKGKVKIWVSTENKFNTGGNDSYILLDKVAIKKNQMIIDVSQLPSEFYKIVLEGKYNAVNAWVLEK